MKNLFVTILLVVAALTAVPAKAQYSMYIWKADSLFMCGEYAQSSAMFDKAFQSERDIQAITCIMLPVWRPYQAMPIRLSCGSLPD